MVQDTWANKLKLFKASNFPAPTTVDQIAVQQDELSDFAIVTNNRYC